ncbi:MinD/ParA family ATP-binding protein [Mycobacterium sp. Z3061]|uniref:MinD/ParA family ATP-binding protein n=1 Tax=Mycobacterium sp. Z3061 TaxID=3073562 RepID=UPI002872D0BE|nr:MinD/ParA family protein [Mycobacterium sp. Z3061]
MNAPQEFLRNRMLPEQPVSPPRPPSPPAERAPQPSQSRPAQAPVKAPPAPVKAPPAPADAPAPATAPPPVSAPVNAPPPTAPRPSSAPPPQPVRPPRRSGRTRSRWPTTLFRSPGATAGPAPRTPDKPVERGWRRMVRSATFGLVKPGPSAAQRDAAQFEATIRTALRGNHKVGVLGKGGVGKTSVAASVGSILAELRQQDRVVAIDADTAFGRLSSRIDPRTTGSFWELTADKNLQSFADVTSRVGRNATGLYVLGGEPVTGPRRVLDPAIYREAALRLDRHFAISVIDCGSTMDAAVTREVLRDLDALIVVSSPWADGAAAAAKTVEWLSDHDLGNLLQRSVVVLNDSDGHADKRTRSLLAREFIDHGQPVVEVPFDPHLRPGGVIDVTQEMGPATRLKFLQVAATITGYFASRTQGSAAANPPDPVRPGAPTGPPSPRSW